MKFSLEMKCSNAAFADDPQEEIARILIEVAKLLQSGNTSGPLVDLNGNRVGAFILKR